MTSYDRSILERAVAAISEQASNTSTLIDEAMDALPADHPVTIAAKMLRLELLKTKAELERGLEEFLQQRAADLHGDISAQEVEAAEEALDDIQEVTVHIRKELRGSWKRSTREGS